MKNERRNLQAKQKEKNAPWKMEMTKKKKKNPKWFKKPFAG